MKRSRWFRIHHAGGLATHTGIYNSMGMHRKPTKVIISGRPHLDKYRRQATVV